MERLTEKRDGQNVIPLRQDGKMKWSLNSAGIGDVPTEFLYGVHADKLAEYEDLEEQGKLLKNSQELKSEILNRMKEFMDEYRSYSESSIDHFGGKADAMETAMRIVNAAFLDAISQLN